MEPVVAKYLARHAESVVRHAEHISGCFSHGVVLPVCNEDASFVDTLESLSKAAAVAGANPVIVVVLNARVDAPEHVHEANRSLHRMMAEHCGVWTRLDADLDRTQLGQLTLLCCGYHHLGTRFPVDQGVGLARKIGCDLLLALRVQGKLSDRWFRTTDADVIVPDDYFASPAAPGHSCFLYPFTHTPADDALKLYEISLRYYVLGLAWACSPYAFHTIGSTMAINATDYARVHGFPRRNAAEDFYLLNKLSKLAPVKNARLGAIRIRGRESDRVPFGTGAALAKFHREGRGTTSFELYHPRVFHVVRDFISAMVETANDRDVGRLLDLWPTMERARLRALRALVAQGTDVRNCLRQLHGWFDALATLRLVHEVRDGGAANMPWQEALEEAPFVVMGGAKASPTEALASIGRIEDKFRTGRSVGAGH